MKSICSIVCISGVIALFLLVAPQTERVLAQTKKQDTTKETQEQKKPSSGFEDDDQSGMQKYTRGLDRAVLEGAYAANYEFLVEDTYPTLEGLKQTLEVQALTDPRAGKAKPEDFVELRFVDEMKKSGFVDKLYGRK